MDNYVITIARGFGSGGKTVAYQLAKQLGIHCYENRILTLASQMTGIDEGKFQQNDEKLDGNLFIQRLASLPRATGVIAVDREFKGNKILFEAQAKIIKELSKTESCIIVGKCSDYVLRNFERKISIYIEAPRNVCVKRIMEKMNIDEKEAERLLIKTDKYRANYYKYYTNGEDWQCPVNYDLTINTAQTGIEGCVDIIKHYLYMKFPDIGE
jgi:cytidylate kinase